MVNYSILAITTLFCGFLESQCCENRLQNGVVCADLSFDALQNRYGDFLLIVRRL